MSTTQRGVELVRTGRLTFRATNDRGGAIDLGPGENGEFTPVELLLVAIAGCTGMDVDAITGKRAEAERFTVTADAEKIRDGDGNHLVGITVDFAVRFPDTEGGAAADAVLETAIRKSHDRLCTVSRTVELASPIAVSVDGRELGPADSG